MLLTIKKYQERLLKNFNTTYKRYLFEKINLDDKMIAIYGARGVGKTTILLQYLKELQNKNKNALYISLDYPFLSGVDLIDIVEEFVNKGGEYLLLDEVHRYNDFSSYLKTIYDIFDIKVVVTGSSAISLLNAKSDLSRRITLYNLAGFSFREFLELKYSKNLQTYSLEEILKNHIDIAKAISTKTILDDFKEYLEVGYYPFYFDKRFSYYQNLLNTINLTIDIDLTTLGLIEQKYTYKLKKLLEVVCQSKPFEVNYTKIAKLAEISRVKLYDYISFLNDAQMLLLIEENAKGLKKINKPAKIYLNNTNLLYAYCQNQETGTIRETFFVNQISTKHKLHTSKQGDFLVDETYTFEVGGANKSFKRPSKATTPQGKARGQIKDVKNSFVVADDIEVGLKAKIPLWLFGFLY
jgi:predicted AAA+ superfamily ATPase